MWTSHANCLSVDILARGPLCGLFFLTHMMHI